MLDITDIVDVLHLNNDDLDHLNVRFVPRNRIAPEDKAHALALVTEYMTLKAGIPVVAFEPPKPVRAWVPYAEASDSTKSGPAPR